MHKRHLLDFMECARRFWWSYHEPAAPELAPGLVAQDRMAEGRSVGRAAREALPGREYERDFEAKGISVRVDILERRPDGLGSRLERHREAVACGGEHVAVVTLDDGADPPVVLRERFRHSVGGSIPERGRTHDVG